MDQALPLTNNIDKNKIYLIPMSVVNDIGILFIWRNRLFRAIDDLAYEGIKNILDCGMIDELVENNLFPKCSVTDYQMDGYRLIIEIDKLEVVSYPYEWSFSMLKDAAVTLLRVNIIARKYGYQTKDSHPFNIIFDGVYPKFIDLGSFVKINNEFNGWIAYEEFLRSLYYPLKIYSRGNPYICRSIIANEGESISHYEYLLYRYNYFIRHFKPAFIIRLINLFFKLTIISSVSNATIKNSLPNLLFAKLFIYLKKKRWLPFQSINFNALIEKIQKISKPETYSQWADYQNEFYDDNGEIISSKRFDRVCNLIKLYDIETAVEFGANQGTLSKLLIQRNHLKYVIATDIDEDAIDTLYLSSKAANLRIYPMIMNCILPVTTSLGELPWQRFRTDVVIALALTHHLLLRYGVKIEFILKTFAKYTNKYIMIEFMPLGLWGGKSAPALPPWYDIDWFRKSLQSFFNILLEEQLEENRVLFFCSLR